VPAHPNAAPYRAVLFDMDGVLTDSEPAFHAAVNDVLARYGQHVSIDDYQSFIGMATPAMWTRMIAYKHMPVTPDAVLEAYEAPLMARLRQPRPALPGARELLLALRERGVPVALCTASYSRWVDAILPSAGLEGLFDAYSTADMVEATKPDPAPYVLAARKLGFAAEQCVAVEDSTNGLTSALRSGAHVIQLRATATAAPPMPGIERIIASLHDFPLELVAG
jgi:HAD superfamily hydrolase (TIGR01509 family)